MRRKGQTLSTLMIAVLLAAATLPAHAENITVQGKVTDASGRPITGTATQFRVQILSPDSNRCVLYDETHTQNLAVSYGLFSINLQGGAGTRNLPNTYTLEQALSNRIPLNVNSSYCQGGGSGVLTFNPANDSNRKVVIQFRDPATMTGWETIPEMDLNPVAYALEARGVGGFPATSILRVVSSGAPGVAPVLSAADVAELQSLAAGTSTNYMSSAAGSTTGARLPTVSGQPATPVPGAIWFDSATGKVKFSPDGTTVQTIGSSAGGTGAMVTSIAGGAGILPSSATGAVTLSLAASGVGAAGAVGSGTTIPEIEYDTYGRITKITPHAINALPSAAGTNGQVLKSDGTDWAPGFVGLNSLRKDALTPLFPGTCAVNRTLNWNSISNVFECVDIGGITSAQLANTGVAANTYRSVTVNAQGQVTAGTNPTTLSGYGITDALDRNSGVPLLTAGDTAARPATSTAGALYVNTQDLTLYRFNGTSWDTVGSAGGGASLTNVTGGTGISVTGTGPSRAVALDGTGTASGNFYRVTTDAYGRVTAGANALVAADVPDLDWSKITTGKPNLVLNGGNAVSLQSGDTASRPLPGTAGRIYVDTTANAVYFDTGSAWQTVASASGSGGTLTDVLPGTGVSVTGTGATRTVGLPNVGTPNTYVKVTTDAQGRVSGGGATLGNADISDLAFGKITGRPTDLGGYGITDGVRNADGSVPAILSGTEAALPVPVAGNLNHLYIANDTYKIFRQIAGTWRVIGAAPGAGFTGSLGGEVSGTQGATQVDSINGITRANITTHLNTVSSATNLNTATTLVKRDGTGGIAAGQASLSSVQLRDSSANTATIQAPNTISSSYTLRLPAGLGSANQVLTTDASGNLSWSTPAVTSGVSVTAPITNSGTAAAPNIGIQTASGSQAGALSSADWTTFNSKLGTALNSALIWVGSAANVATPVSVSGDATIANTGALTVTGIRGRNVTATAPTTGQHLRFDGTNYAPGFTALSDIRSSATGTAVLPSTCTAKQTLSWNSVTDVLTCVDIAGLDAATVTTGVLPVANGGTGANSVAANRIFASPVGSAGAPAFRALDATDLPASANAWTVNSSDVFRAGGSVGIGTTAPDYTLDVRGDLAVQRNSKIRFGTPTPGGNGEYIQNAYANGGTYGLSFNVGTTERARIDSAGNLGIGTTNPTSTLHVNSAGAKNGGLHRLTA